MLNMIWVSGRNWKSINHGFPRTTCATCRAMFVLNHVFFPGRGWQEGAHGGPVHRRPLYLLGKQLSSSLDEKFFFWMEKNVVKEV